MFLINLFGILGSNNKPATFARPARKSEMNQFDLFMTVVCEKLGIISRQE